MSKRYIQNHYRVEKIKNKYLLTTDTGSWALLNKPDFDLFRLEKVEKKKKLFNELEQKGLIITEKNVETVINLYRQRNSFLFEGASLHVVVPTLRCNLKCIYCHASSKPMNAKGYDMDKAIAKKTVEFIFQSPAKGITIEFQGGEPLANFPIVQYIIEYSKKLNKKHKKELSFALVTNLTLMTDTKMKYLIDHGVGLCTSLDGPKEIHDKNRPYPNHALVTKWIEKINEEYKKRKDGRQLNALLTLTKNALPYENEILNEYTKNGFKQIHLRFLSKLGSAQHNWKNISYSPEEFVAFLEKSYKTMDCGKCKIVERIRMIMLQKIFGKYDPGYLELRSPCGAAIGQLVYNYDGKIYTCDEGRMTGNDLFMIGDVKKDKYKKVLTSQQVCSIISASINDSMACENCVYKPYCGVCPVCEYDSCGSIISKVPESNRCKIFKSQFEQIFEKRCT